MRLSRRRHHLGLSVTAMLAGGALILSLIARPVGAQENGSDARGQHWVGTWATAVIGRPPAASPAQRTVPAPTTTSGGQTPPGTPQNTPAAVPGGSQATSASPQGGQRLPPPPLQFNNQTLRQIVRTSIGGERLRIVLSNRFGTAPMRIDAVHLALRGKESAIVPTSDHAVLFSGRPSVVIPSAAVAVSDPVDLAVPPQTDLAIDLYLPNDTATSPSPLT